MKKSIITQDALKALVRYESKTGKFYWLKTRNGGCKIDDEAGTITIFGYRRICIFGSKYFASRLAWLYVTGVYPNKMVDHKNRIRHDDRFDNLRLASRGQNVRNSKLRKDNSSGYKGVYLNHGRWQAGIRFNKKFVHVGMFATREEAAAAIIKKQRQLDPVFYG